MEEDHPEEILEELETSEPPSTQSRRWKLLFWSSIAAVFTALTILLIWGQVSGTDTEEQSRNASVATALDQLKQKTNGAISVDDAQTFQWDGHGAVALKLIVGSCHQVSGYASTPAQPNGVDQVTIHLVIPGSNSDAAAADLPLKTDDDLKHAQKTVSAGSLKQCTLGNQWFQPAG